ncbi:MAG: type IV toxin-antitoxin system AbiEi family antitoxin domain-containing protein [Spirochaetaceae bacterium]|nr:type IV toxin-antitoxin system AbiEi family antitoxin domain-containing protein [Spirochaetaceae bacterium]
MQNTVVETLPNLVETFWLADLFKDYSDPKAKIRRLVRDGWIKRLRPGLYINTAGKTDPDVLMLAANRIYGPSYVSFASALRRHNLIPEAVPNITSATYRKRRTKTFHTTIGSFFYRDVPPAVFPHGVDLAGERSDARYLVAGPQKALLDQLSTVAGIRSRTALRDLLFADIRIDADSLQELSFADAIDWAAGYRSDAVDTFMGSLSNGRADL